MTIIMLQTKEGSTDGTVVNRYKKGQTYDVADSLAEVFVKEGWAKQVKEKASTKSTEGNGGNPSRDKKKP